MKKDSKISNRICVGCGKAFDRKALLKITAKKNPEYELILDYQQKVPGRSIYLNPSLRCWNKLVYNKRKCFRKLQLSNLQFTQKQMDDLLTKLKDALPNTPCLGCAGGENAE